MIVLVDDENRENEGDLVCAAQFISPDTVNFMLREGRGVMCLALAGSICDHLELLPQAPVNTTQRGTAFTVSIDAGAASGVTTGVSAADRAMTIQVAIDENTRPVDLDRPGHVNPLRARDGGVLVRAGQTEGSVDLCRIAGLKPAAVVIEIMNEDGSMARLTDLKKLCARHQLKICSVAQVIEYRLQRQKLIDRIDEMPLRTKEGAFRLIAYHSLVDSLPHVALVAGDVGRLGESGEPIELAEPVLVRMHSQNLLGDVFGDLEQDTDRILQTSMQMIQSEGCGAIVYLRHEKMGTGLLERLQTLQLPDDQLGAVDRPTIGQSRQTSGESPGAKSPVGKGAYGIGAQILGDLGIRKLRLLTNHPFQPAALRGFGLEIVEFVSVGTDPVS